MQLFSELEIHNFIFSIIFRKHKVINTRFMHTCFAYFYKFKNNTYKLFKLLKYRYA